MRFRFTMLKNIFRKYTPPENKAWTINPPYSEIRSYRQRRFLNRFHSLRLRYHINFLLSVYLNPDQHVFKIFFQYRNSIQCSELDAFLFQLPSIFPNLDKIALFYDHLSEIPSSFRSFKNLTTLVLNSPALQHIRDDFFLDHPYLTDIGILGGIFSALPSSLGSLVHLTHLRVDNNPHLHDLPESLGNLASIEIIELNDNCIYHLPDSLAQCPCLKRINIQQGEPVEYYSLAIARKVRCDTYLEQNEYIIESQQRNLPRIQALLTIIQEQGISTLTQSDRIFLSDNATREHRDVLERCPPSPRLTSLIQYIDSHLAIKAQKNTRILL